MEDTLEFVEAAAAEDSHRRDGALRWRCEMTEARHVGLELEERRDARTQQRAVYEQDRDIVDSCGVDD